MDYTTCQLTHNNLSHNHIHKQTRTTLTCKSMSFVCQFRSYPSYFGRVKIYARHALYKIHKICVDDNGTTHYTRLKRLWNRSPSRACHTLCIIKLYFVEMVEKKKRAVAIQSWPIILSIVLPFSFAYFFFSRARDKVTIKIKLRKIFTQFAAHFCYK